MSDSTVLDRQVALRQLGVVLPRRRYVDIASVIAGTALIAALGQVAVPLWFTPVPLSLGTLAALGVGACLGARLGSLSVVLLLVAGVAGAPVFAGGVSGWAFASFGYVLGYVPAAVVMGQLAQRGGGRSVLRIASVAVGATAIVHAVGAPWLAVYAGLDLRQTFSLGVIPFLAGDVVKALILAFCLTASRRVGSIGALRRSPRSTDETAR